MKDFFTYVFSPIISGLLGVVLGSWLTLRIQKKAEVRADIKDIRNRLIFLRANLEAYEYIIIAQAEDYIRGGYNYALNCTESRFAGMTSISSKESDERIEKIRDKYELTIFEFRKLTAELKTFSDQKQAIEKLLLPFNNEDFDKWNFKFNAMETEKELNDYLVENKEDMFGQGGKSMEPTKSVREKNQEFKSQFKDLYILVDAQIYSLMPKEIITLNSSN